MGKVQQRSSTRRLIAGLLGPPIVIATGLLLAAVFLIPIPEDNNPPSFTFDKTFALDKIAPGGTDYTVNNSTATFDLDLADDDGHCDKLFRDYAAALSYCQQANLPTCPSVHLFQGKCKQFDEGLTAALELAIQNGQTGDSRLGKQAALERLLVALLSLSEELTGTDRTAADGAVVHVATALKLGGAEPQTPKRLAHKIAQAEVAFLELPAATPIGFWTWNDELRAIFL